MPITTNLDVSPYWDDYNTQKDFYRILFKPGVAVQTRELNQVQSILQNQIEQIGDNLFVQGPIISGCNFTLYPYYPYIKINDNTIAGVPASVYNYIGNFAKNSANLQALILNANSGYQSQDPNLNTLYLKYINSGNTQNLTAFAAGDILTIFDSNNSIFSVNILNGSIGFSNVNSIVFEPAMIVNVSSSNTFANGELITQATTGAKAVIQEVNTTAIPGSLVLKVAPQTSDLANATGTSAAWTFDTGFNITSNTTSSVANVVTIIGSGAQASLITDGLGVVKTINMVSQGNGYTVIPWTTIQSTTGTISGLNLLALNYQAQLTVASTANSVGNAYAVGVSNGVIFQKGYLLNVNTQVIVVGKYANNPDNVSIGFATTENLINSNSDSSLLDNAIGTYNVNAPGADRLQLIPNLIVLPANQVFGNNQFFPLISFSNGQPYGQNQTTAYNVIGDEMSLRTFDASGDFVLDDFLITTATDAVQNNLPVQFTTIVDPGYAYVGGRRVRTYTNYTITVQKTTNTFIGNSAINLNYGNFIRLNNLGGQFQFETGDVVNLYDTAVGYLSNTALVRAGNPAAAGNLIGQARIRSLVYESGTPGAPNAIYRAYLFKVNMNSGQNIQNVKSLFYNGSSYTGVGDVIQVLSGTTNGFITQIVNNDIQRMLFNSGFIKLKNANNINYQYKAHSTALTANTSGAITITLSASGLTFPYTQGTNLTSTQVNDIVVIPNATATAAANLAGSLSTNTTSANVTGTSTTFLSVLVPGDYIKIYNSSVSAIHRVQNIVNNTLLIIDANCAIACTTANAILTFPDNVPVNMQSHSRFINLDATQKILTINFNTGIAANTSMAAIYNIQSSNATPATKTPNRNTAVLINISNNAGTNTANIFYSLWSLGVPDAFRLKHVYYGSNLTNANTSSQDVTTSFLINNGQHENFYDASYLKLNPKSSFVPANTGALLVIFDNFTASVTNSLYSVSSYSTNDALSLTQLDSNTVINSYEVPEFISQRGNYYDLNGYFDFRPMTVNTAIITSNVSAAPVNPPSPTFSGQFGNTANPANILNFPVPDSQLSFQVEYYLPRIDRVFVDSNGNINEALGQPALKMKPPASTLGTLTINYLSIPAYPCYETSKSSNLVQIIDKKIITNGIQPSRRLKNSLITILKTNQAQPFQPKRYTMRDIGGLDRRISTLENQMALTVLELTIRDKIIPSSVNPTINRFKYGFFADSFTNGIYTQSQSTQHCCSVGNGKVTPLKEVINLPFQYDLLDLTTNSAVAGTKLMFPFANFILVGNPFVTWEPIPQPAPAVANTANTPVIAPTQHIGTTTVTPQTFTPVTPAPTQAPYSTNTSTTNYSTPASTSTATTTVSTDDFYYFYQPSGDQGGSGDAGSGF